MLPKSAVFCVCEKVIASEDQTISVIAIMEKLTIGAEEPAAGASPFFVPLPWASLAIWTRDDASKDQTFEQKIEAFSDGATEAYLSSPVVTFPFPKGTYISKVRYNGFGMPVGRAGRKRFVVSIREPGSTRWHVGSEYPLEIAFDPSQPAPAPA